MAFKPKWLKGGGGWLKVDERNETHEIVDVIAKDRMVTALLVRGTHISMAAAGTVGGW